MVKMVEVPLETLMKYSETRLKKRFSMLQKKWNETTSWYDREFYATEMRRTMMAIRLK